MGVLVAWLTVALSLSFAPLTYASERESQSFEEDASLRGPTVPNITQPLELRDDGLSIKDVNEVPSFAVEPQEKQKDTRWYWLVGLGFILIVVAIVVGKRGKD